MGHDRIRVLFAIGSLAGGGSERQVIEILRHLDRARFAPLLYLVYRDGPLLAEVPDDVPVFAFSDRSTSPRASFPGRIHGLQVDDLCQVLRDQHVDVIYDRTWHMTLIAGPAARRASVPRVSVVVSNPRRDLADNLSRFAFAKRWLLRRAYRQAFRVVAVSEGVRLAVIDEYRLPADRVQTIYNVLDLDRLDRLAGAGEPDCDGSRFQIVAAGRLQFAKGYRYLLEALDELVNRRGRRQLLLHILGEGPLEAELKEFVAAHRLEQHVRFAAHVPNPYPYFRRAQLFCLPSLYEGMPNALIEALACRVQVLATDCPNGPREILAGGKHGRLVPPADAMALADAIDAVLLDHMQGRGLVTDARRHVEETFSVSAGMARLESLLLSAARGS